MNFESFLHANGLIVDHAICDGRWHRTKTEGKIKKRNGSYKLAPDGLIGWVQDFGSMSEPLTWRPDRAYEAPKVDHAAIARRQAEDRRALVRATQAAREFYLGCKPLLNGHPYLEAHHLTMTGCFGLRIDRDGWMVVPVLLEQNVMSVQRISPTGEKLFWKNASVKGASYTIDRAGASVTVLCEGISTGLAIFAAVPLSRVVVCFSSGNLVAVAKRLRGNA